MEPYVSHFEKDSIGYLEFGHPSANSLPLELLQKLEQKLNILSKNRQVKVIVIQSNGHSTFCAGASFNEMKKMKNKKEATAFFMGFANLINTIRSLNKFIIAKVQGKVVGGGVGLVAACDNAFALEAASVKLSELSIGIGPYVIEPAVSRKIGAAAFRELSLDANKWKPAKWAKKKGLYRSVCKSKEALNQKVLKTATRLARYPQKANTSLRKLHWKETDHWDVLLPKNAEITAKLALEKATQDILKKM
jgi:methylglutaconyl-CoA hydratase